MLPAGLPSFFLWLRHSSLLWSTIRVADSPPMALKMGLWPRLGQSMFSIPSHQGEPQWLVKLGHVSQVSRHSRKTVGLTGKQKLFYLGLQGRASRSSHVDRVWMGDRQETEKWGRKTEGDTKPWWHRLHTWIWQCGKLATPVLSSYMHACVLSYIWFSVTHESVAHQASLSMRFSRQEYWSGLSFPSPGDHPDLQIISRASCTEGRFFIAEPPGKPFELHKLRNFLFCLTQFEFNFPYPHPESWPT